MDLNPSSKMKRLSIERSSRLKRERGAATAGLDDVVTRATPVVPRPPSLERRTAATRSGEGSRSGSAETMAFQCCSAVACSSRVWTWHLCGAGLDPSLSRRACTPKLM